MIHEAKTTTDRPERIHEHPISKKDIDEAVEAHKKQAAKRDHQTDRTERPEPETVHTADRPHGKSQPDRGWTPEQWTKDVLSNGTDGFMKALMDGDKSAQEALSNPAFTATLQAKMNEQNQIASTISNLIEAQHKTAMASIQNLRV